MLIPAPHGRRRPNILFLAQVLPFPLDSGPKVRAYHVLRWLAARGHLHLACFVRDDDPPDVVERLRRECAAVHVVPMRRSPGSDAGHLLRAMLGGKSFVIARDEVAGMRRLLEQLVGETEFDAVHADQLWMAQYARPLDVPFKVLDQHNAVYRVFQRLARNDRSRVRRWLLRSEARRLACYEAAQMEAFDEVLFVSGEDREAVLAVCPTDRSADCRERSTVMPICLDVDAIPMVDVLPDARRVTVLGTMYWPPNVEGVRWLADHVWPLVLDAVPHAVLTVIGKRPPPEVRSLAERFGPSVEVTGYVADPVPYLRETAVFAVPLLSGGGMRVKILDAWAWGLPVVSTVVGQEGMRSAPGHLLLAQDAAEFVRHTVRLLTDERERVALRRRGRAVVEAHYNVATEYQRLHAVYEPVWRAAGVATDPGS